MITQCCGAYTTIVEGVQCCKACFKEVDPLDTYEETNGTHYRFGTPKGLIEVLERARENRFRVAVVYEGDSVPEFGRVGRCCGPALKVPLLLHNARSSGGGEICTRIVREVRTAVGGKVLYPREA